MSPDLDSHQASEPQNQGKPVAPSSNLLTAKLLYLEQRLEQECEWVWDLSLEVIADRHKLEAGFLEDSELMLIANRNQYRHMLKALLALELDVTRYGALLEELEGQIAKYQRIVAALIA